MSEGLYRTGMGKVGWPPPLHKPLSPASTINMATNLSLFSSVSLKGCTPAAMTPIQENNQDAGDCPDLSDRPEWRQ